MLDSRPITAAETWATFARLPGATLEGEVLIASENAIDGLLRILRRRRPSRILELGSGIGTLTYAVLAGAERLGLDRSAFRFVTVESNDFCCQQLAENLAGLERSYELVEGLEALDPHETFDLIIVDGGGEHVTDLGPIDFSNRVARRGAIFIEGYRIFERERIGEWYRDRQMSYASRIALFRRTLSAPQAGFVARNKAYHVFLFEPSRRERLAQAAQRGRTRLIDGLRRRLS